MEMLKCISHMSFYFYRISTNFDSYKNISIMNTLLRPAFNEGRGDFTRKGEVGDWVNHFHQPLNDTWNVWIKRNLDRISITDQNVRKLFQIE